MSANNQGGVAEENHYARFDSLPVRFRRMLNYGSEDYLVGWVWQLIHTLGREAAYRVAAERLRLRRREIVRKYYGPSHPQVCG